MSEDRSAARESPAPDPRGHPGKAARGEEPHREEPPREESYRITRFARTAGLVGREAESAALLAAIRTARAGEGSVLFVVGEAGIGKSRLVDDAALAARARGLGVLRGRAGLSGGSGMRPFAEALLGLARDGWTPPRGLAPYRGVLGRLVPDWRTEEAAAADSVAHPVGPPPDEPFVYGEAVLRVLTAAGERARVLILEDLHDADPTAIAALEYLVDNVAGRPVTVIGTLRDVGCPALDLARYAGRRAPGALLTLPRLDIPATAEPAAALLGADDGLLPPGLGDALFPRGAGNPPAVGEPMRAAVAGRAPTRRAAADRAGPGPVSAAAACRLRLALALDALLRARFAEAEELVAAARESADRLGLPELGSRARALAVLLHAHRGHDAELTAARADFDRWRGARADEVPLVEGLGLAVRALLSGAVAAARAQLAGLPQAGEKADPADRLGGRHGLALLLAAVDGAADAAEHEAAARHPAALLPWNSQFVHLARSVLAGRAGDCPAAEAAVARARSAAEPFPLARRLGLVVVARSAARDGWGDPIGWLLEAESFFTALGIPVAARHCRDVLRGLGARVRQRRSGSVGVPRELWVMGATVREYDVLVRLAQRRTNREIAAELHISHRTVERHVANLLAKTGAVNRRDLGTLFAPDRSARSLPPLGLRAAGPEPPAGGSAAKMKRSMVQPHSG
ncbi:AAA family ATPase [Streptomyces sp. NBC_01190]|uniref:AAA family ATPase n=1 Tax=Streptomyces sp. NBC_01190 TaxID=2903767 RepID=UPI00386568ED|nr:LuxR family transcriptional regulator [Streptomyces sp. NBC_01190]